MQGLARVLRKELSNHRMTTISFEFQDTISDWQLQSLVRVLNFIHLDQATNKDVEYLQIGETLNIPRVIPNTYVSLELQTRSKPQNSGNSLVQDAPPLELIVGSPGILDGLHFVEDKTVSEPLADDEIELETKAIGMNFKDCLVALGQIKRKNGTRVCRRY